MVKVVILDYGHSASTPGKCSPDKSFFEWQFNRDLGKRIAALLKSLNFEIHETVKEDEDGKEVSLSERAARANAIAKGREKDCIFVSVHANAAGGDGKWHEARGWSVFVAKNASERSRLLANCIATQHQDYGFKVRKPLPKQLYWEENFTVIYRTIMPGVLVENLFYDNKEDLKILQSEEGKKKLASACAGGILDYFAK